jgi:catechol 2,3-dioxygenase-like lactoylglutathione lyase family enzyme
VSPAHQAYTVTPQARDKIAAGLAAQGITLHRFHEDRPTEADDNYYFDDPAGNRIQLVAKPAAGGGANAIDHVAIETHNIHWAREFYGAWLNCPVEHRVGWKTDDYLSAKALGEAGMAAAMPGARYWNERYSKFEKERKALRPNVQVYFTLGGDASLAVYLASRKYQAPRDDQILGAPRTALRTSRKGLDAVASFFGEHGRTVEGPVEHDRTSPIAASVYVKDPGGNFLEFCALR